MGITLKNVLYISSNSMKFSAFSFYMYSPTLNIWFLNLVFLCFMYSLCRSSHRCINHLILDSGDSSEVPGTLANDVFKFVLKSNFSPSLKTRLSNVYFSFYFSIYHPFTYFQNNVVHSVPIPCFLKSVGVLLEL